MLYVTVTSSSLALVHDSVSSGSRRASSPKLFLQLLLLPLPLPLPLSYPCPFFLSASPTLGLLFLQFSPHHPRFRLLGFSDSLGEILMLTTSPYITSPLLSNSLLASYLCLLRDHQVYTWKSHSESHLTVLKQGRKRKQWQILLLF